MFSLRAPSRTPLRTPSRTPSRTPLLIPSVARLSSELRVRDDGGERSQIRAPAPMCSLKVFVNIFAKGVRKDVRKHSRNGNTIQIVNNR